LYRGFTQVSGRVRTEGSINYNSAETSQSPKISSKLVHYWPTIKKLILRTAEKHIEGRNL
jgi:hypothetical protein